MKRKRQGAYTKDPELMKWLKELFKRDKSYISSYQTALTSYSIQKYNKPSEIPSIDEAIRFIKLQEEIEQDSFSN